MLAPPISEPSMKIEIIHQQGQRYALVPYDAYQRLVQNAEILSYIVNYKDKAATLPASLPLFDATNKS